MKKMLCLFLVFLLTASFSACSSEEQDAPTPAQVKKYEYQQETPVSGGTLKLCMYEVDTLNPLVTKNFHNIKTLKLIYDSLFDVNSDFSYTPNLCESYTVSDDGLRYSFHIKSGVSFHSGARLTASDVDFSFKLLSQAESVYKAQFANVKSTGASGMTFQVTLNNPMANLPALLDFPVLSERGMGSAANAIKESAAYTPNGTGQYKVQSYKMNKELYLSVNENYHKGETPYLTNINISLLTDRSTAISMLENLGVDLLPSDVVNLSEYTPKRDVNTVDYPTNKLTFIGINNEHPALSTAQTRQAISLCIDREQLVKTQQNSRAVAANSFIHPSSWLADKEVPVSAHDPAGAKALLSSDGWADTDADGILDRMDEEEKKIDLKLDILVNEENAARIKIANLLKAGLEELGVTVTVTQLPFSQYTKRINQKYYDLFIGELNLPADMDLSPWLKTGENVFNYTNPEMDSLLEQASKMTNTTAIVGVYHNICKLLAADMPIAGLYFKNDALIFDGKLKGNILPSESDLYRNIKEWFIK